MRKILTSLIAAGVLVAGGFVAASIAAPGSAAAQEADDSIVAPAITTIAEVIQGLVDDGTLDQSQADAVVGALEQHRDEMREQHEQRHAARAEAAAEHFQAMADIIGTTVEDLRAQLSEDATLAEIAGDQVDELRTFLTDEATAHIDEALADGRIDAERAEELKANLGDHIEERLNSNHPFSGRRGHHRHPRGGGGGQGPSA